MGFCGGNYRGGGVHGGEQRGLEMVIVVVAVDAYLRAFGSCFGP